MTKKGKTNKFTAFNDMKALTCSMTWNTKIDKFTDILWVNFF